MFNLTAGLLILLTQIANAANPDAYADFYVTSIITVSSVVTSTEIADQTETITITDSETQTAYNTVSVEEVQSITVTDTTTSTTEYISVVMFSTCTTLTVGPFYSTIVLSTETVTSTETAYETTTPTTELQTITTNSYYSTYTAIGYETTISIDTVSIGTCPSTSVHEVQTSLLVLQLQQYQVSEKSTFNLDFDMCPNEACLDGFPSLLRYVASNYFYVASMKTDDISSIYNSWTTTFSQYQSAELDAASSGYGSSQMLDILTTYTSRMFEAWSSWTQSQIDTLDALNPSGSSVVNPGNTRHNSVSKLTNTAWPTQYSLLSSILSVESTSFTNFLSANSTLF